MTVKTDKLLLAGFWSSLCYSLSYPVIHLYILKDINSNLISLISLLSCIFTILISKAWNVNGDKIYKQYSILLIAESIFYFVLMILMINNILDKTIYYLLDGLLFAILTRNIICGGNKMKANRYIKEDMEHFANNLVIYNNIASLMGYSIGSLFHIDIKLSFVIMFLGVSIDNLFSPIAENWGSARWDILFIAQALVILGVGIFLIKKRALGNKE